MLNIVHPLSVGFDLSQSMPKVYIFLYFCDLGVTELVTHPLYSQAVYMCKRALFEDIVAHITIIAADITQTFESFDTDYSQGIVRNHRHFYNNTGDFTIQVGVLL